MHKFWKVTPNEVQTIADERAARLREFSFVELSALPANETGTVLVGDQKVETCTYRDMLPDGRVRIVAQAYRLRLLGIGTMTVDGFIMSSDGIVSEVPQEMMYEFI